MSRLIVKSLPNNLPESKLKELFQKFGEVTDCRIIFRDKKNRRFAFVGFKNEDSGKKAQEYYNNTYINMSKITVEFAKTLDDDNLPRAWSKLTKKDKGDFQKRGTKKEKVQDKIDNKLDKLEEKTDKFKEYLDLMTKGGAVKNSWGDNVDTFDPVEDRKKKREQKKRGNERGSDSDDGDELPQENEKVAKKVGNKVKIIQDGNGEKRMKSEVDQLNSILKKGNNAVAATKKDDKIEQEREVDTKRLYVINLPFQTTEEEVRAVFEKFGNITNLKLPKGKGGKFTGYAYVSYETEEEAIRAFAEIENKIHMGRILHVKPAYKEIIKEKDQLPGGAHEKTTYKREKKMEMLKKLEDQTNWNTLFLNPNSVVGAIADKFNLKKREILDENATDMAVRISLAETQIINETKQWLQKEGINLAFLELDRKTCERSKTVILMKNVQYKIDTEELKKLFAYYGILIRFMLSPNNSIGIVEFENETFAANAFKKLSYFKFCGEPLYLEWAPVNLFENKNPVARKSDVKQELAEDGTIAEEVNEKILFVKNLNFKSNEKDLKDLFLKNGFATEDLKSVRIAKKNGLSAGYGFVEMKAKETVEKALKTLQNKILDEHALSLSVSKRRKENNESNRSNKRTSETFKEPTNKIVIRNLAFEATKDDVLQLFRNHAEVKSVRLPMKLNKQHRGFAFVEFVSVEEAKKAKEALFGTHLYGRKLNLEFAEKDRNLESYLMEGLK